MCQHAARSTRPAFRQTQTAAERGYGWEWEQTRARVYARDPVCYLCKAKPTAICDHVLAQRLARRVGATSPVVLRGICRGCNLRKVQRESVVGRMLMRDSVTLSEAQVMSLVLWPWLGDKGEDPLLERVTR